MTSVPTLDDLGPAQLAVLVREYLMAGHLIDRAGMPQLIAAFGADDMTAIAIDEWMAASPIYTARTQRVLGFGGDDVETIFKGMQFDIGAPPQFMDFRYEVHDHDHGEFRLAHCGALMDVEPMGEDFVVAMCHHIEDPTFPATACATNPRAVVLPVHRPPRRPADRHPHCHWTVDIDPDREPVQVAEVTRRLAATAAASLELPARVDDGGEGWRDYSAPLDPDLRMEAFAPVTLRRLADEAALQGHLLVLGFLDAVTARHGAGAAAAIGRSQLAGVGGVASTRLRDAFGLAPGLDAVATVLALHPAFHPRAYVDARIEPGDGTVRLAVGDCPARHEEHVPSWIGLLGDAGSDPVPALVWGVDPRARTERVDPVGDEVLAWEVTPTDEAAPEPEPVTLTRFSTGADFVFDAS